MVKKVSRTNGVDNLLQAVFPWKIETNETEAKLILTILARTPKPGFAVTVSDDLRTWTVYMSDNSYRVTEVASENDYVTVPAGLMNKDD